MNLDLDKLEQLATVAETGGQHIYTNPRDSNKWQANETFIAAASPEVVAELVRQVRAAEATLDTKIDALSCDTVLVKTDRPGDIARSLQAMLERGIIKQAVIVGAETDLTSLNEAEMRKAGWLRADKVEEDAARYRYILSAEPMDPGVWDALEGHGSVVDGEFDQADYAANLNRNIDRARTAQGTSIAEEDAAIASRVDQVIAEHGANHG